MTLMFLKKKFLLLLCLCVMSTALAMKPKKGKATAKVSQEKASLAELVRIAANPDAADAQKFTAIKEYKRAYGLYLKNQNQCKTWLVKQSAHYTGAMLAQACLYGCKPFIQFLADGIVDPQAPNAFLGDNKTVLSIACEIGKIGSVETLLALGVPVNVKDVYGDTPLSRACFKGCPAIVTLLLDRGALIEEVDKDGVTPLCLAVGEGNFNVAKLLIERGANVNANSLRFGTPLYQACKLRRLEIAQLLIDNGALMDALVGDTTGTILYAMVQENELEVVRLLVRNGANIHFKMHGVFTTLYLACLQGHVPLAQFLHDQGADFDKTSDAMQCLLHTACKANNVEMARFLSEHGADASKRYAQEPSFIITACCNGNAELLELLIAHGASINTPLRNDSSLLHAASYYGHKNIAAILVGRGMDVDVKNAQGVTPLLKACESGNKEMIERLVALGADVHARDHAGANALHAAAWFNHLSVLQYLNAKGIMLDNPINSGSSAIHQVCYKGHLELLKFILESRPDLVNARGAKGLTPLSVASMMQHVAVVKLLLAHNADTTLQSDMGTTALDYAVDKENNQILALLRDHVRVLKNKKKSAKKKALNKIKKMNALANKTHECKEEQSAPAPNAVCNANDNNAPLADHKREQSEHKPSVTEEAIEASKQEAHHKVTFDHKFKWPQGISAREQRGIEERLQRFKASPVNIKKLKCAENQYRLRFNKYRIVFEWDSTTQAIHVLRIGLRKTVYKIF